MPKAAPSTWAKFRPGGYGAVVVPPPVPHILDITFQGDETAHERGIVEEARDFIEAGFITPPMLHNGDRQIHVDVDVHDDPPNFDGVPGGRLGVGTRAGIRPDGTTYDGFLILERASMNQGFTRARLVALAMHELLHVMGFGTSNNWTAHVVGAADSRYFTGPNALAAYRAMPGGFPAAIGVPLQVIPPGNGGHWHETADGVHTSGQACMDLELMGPFNDNQNTWSRVTSGALIDQGYAYDPNHGFAIACGGF